MATSSNSHVAARETEWERLGELGMEAGLLHSGIPKWIVARILSWELDLIDGRAFLNTTTERATFLALVGRSSSRVNHLHLRGWALTAEAATALCVNLRSNMNIQTLDLSTNKVFGTEYGCTLLGSALATNAAVRDLRLSTVNFSGEAVACLLDWVQGNKTLLKIDISDNDLSEKANESVAKFLMTNCTLKVLDVTCTGLHKKYLQSALEVNTSLEELRWSSGVIGWTMGTSNNSDVAAWEAEWERLGELGMEAGLRGSGFSTEKVAQLLSWDQSGEIEQWHSHQFLFSKAERATFLALVGRSSSRVNRVHLRGWVLTVTEAIALCVNLRSNVNIQTLDLSTNKVFGTEYGCTLLGSALATNAAVRDLRLSTVNFSGEAVACLLDWVQGNKTILKIDISDNDLSEKANESVAKFLMTNCTLKVLDVTCTGLHKKYLQSALEVNTSLEELRWSSGVIGWTMGTSNNSDVAAWEAEWERLGELGMEAGLRGSGFSTEKVAQLLSWDQSGEIEQWHSHQFLFSKAERATFLALVGRSSSRVNRVHLRGWVLTVTEAIALCVNLRSNVNIQTLDLSTNQVFGTETGCTLLGSALTTNASVQDLCLSTVNLSSEAVACLLDLVQGNKTLLKIDISDNDLSEKANESVAKFLMTNCTLKVLDVTCTGLHKKYLQLALEVNTSLEELRWSGVIGWTKGTSNNSDVAAWETEWERLGELGMEAGLLESGFSTEKVAELLNWDQSEETDQWQSRQLIYSKAERATFLALVGRSSSRVNRVHLRDWVLTVTEAIALCVNLRSNVNIQSLDLSRNEVFGTETGCTLLGSALTTNASVQDLRLSTVNLSSEAVACLLDLVQGNKTLLKIDISDNDLSEKANESVAKFLMTNCTLKFLDVTCTGLRKNSLQSALEVNTSLEELRCGVIGWTMGTSNNSDVAAWETEWKRLGELGIKAGLLESGFSTEKVAQLLSWDQSEEIDQRKSRQLLYSKAERATFLALVGRSSSRVKRLHLRGWVLTVTEAIALCVNLKSNVNIQSLDLSRNKVFGTEIGCTLLGSALTTNASVRDLHLSTVNFSSEAVACLLDLVQGNKTLLNIDISDNDLSEKADESVAKFLMTNCTLKGLDVTRTCTGLHAMLSALEVNTSLEELRFGGSHGNILRLLETLRRPKSLFGAKNSTMKRLHLVGLCVHAEALALMISKNNTLTTLSLEADFSPQDWKDKIFPALKENSTLEELIILRSSAGFLAEEDVHLALMDLVRCSNTLTHIDLTGTRMEHLQSVVDEELRVNREYRAKLRGQTTVQAVSGRLVLCGYGYAGKTAILKTMERIEQGTPCSHSYRVGWKKLWQKCHRQIRQFFLGSDTHMELTNRTRGFTVVAFKKKRYLKYIWDFAGQKEFYSLHDYLFPDTTNSCFLYVCSSRGLPDEHSRKGAVKSREMMKSECEFWMKFIASNSKPLQAQEGLRRQLPSVRFVLTKKDTLNPDDLSTSEQWAELVVGELRQAFKGVLDLCETVEVVNAHSLEDVERLFELTDNTLEGILSDQTQYGICEDVRKGLVKLSVENPIMSIQDFQSIQHGTFNFADAPTEVKEAVLAYLNDIGEVVSPRGFDFIADPGWFGVCVLGFLIDTFKGVEDLDPLNVHECFHGFQHGKQVRKLVHDHGYLDIIRMKNLLNNSLRTTHLQQSISSDKLIDLMIHLELCFKKDPSSADSALFLPALFDDETERAARGERQLSWKLVQTGTLQYLGRRLECENKAVTFLTPGFFPRFQVHLRNYIHEKKWTENPGFAVDRNLICFADNGIEVLVEYSGDVDYFVDVLVRSSKPHSVALEFIEKHVMKNILDFCASPQGCQGVTLVEAVIRPKCVTDLCLCVERKDHSVLVSILKGRLEEDEGYEHTWRNKMEGGPDMDFALDLLEGECSDRRSITSPDVAWSMPMVPGSSSTYHFPRLFYPSIEDVSVLRTLDARLSLAKRMAIKLHLLCDHKDGCHKVENQPGRTIILNWKAGGYNVNISKLALTLLWSGASVAASVAGVRLPQVDNWIERLYSVSEMPDIDAETLHHMMNRGKTNAPVSNQQILKAWEQYLKIDPDTQGLKEILNLEDGKRFWSDFRLRKVVYKEGRIGWVCGLHHRQGLERKILRSTHH